LLRSLGTANSTLSMKVGAHTAKARWGGRKSQAERRRVMNHEGGVGTCLSPRLPDWGLVLQRRPIEGGYLGTVTAGRFFTNGTSRRGRMQPYGNRSAGLGLRDNFVLRNVRWGKNRRLDDAATQKTYAESRGGIKRGSASSGFEELAPEPCPTIKKNGSPKYSSLKISIRKEKRGGIIS